MMNKLFIVSKDLENLLSELLGIIVIIPFLSILLSFIKKNEMNNTENKPTLKLPKVPNTEFNKLGIALN